MFKRSLAYNAELALFSPLKGGLRPITLNATTDKYQKLTLKK